MDSIEPGERERQLALMCHALGHPLRISIMRFVAAHPGCICNEIVLRTDRAQSTISGHLRVLINAGLLEWEHEGQASAYWVAPGALAALQAALNRMAPAAERGGRHG